MSWPGCYVAEAEYSTKGISYLCAICKIKVPAKDWDAHVAKNAPRPIRSGDLIATGTGAARRRLTLAEAEAGGLPDRFTEAEWAAMAKASKGDA